MAERKRLTVADRNRADELKNFRDGEKTADEKARARFRNLEILAKHQFKPGNQRAAGRPPGSRNKLTTILREGVETAAMKAGYVYQDSRGRHRATALGGVDGYLLSLAENHPNLFTKLMLACFTAEVNGKTIERLDQNRVFRTVEEMRQRMKERGIPIPPHLKMIDKK